MLDIVDQKYRRASGRESAKANTFLRNAEPRENGAMLPVGLFLRKQNSEIFRRQDNRFRVTYVKNDPPLRYSFAPIRYRPLTTD